MKQQQQKKNNYAAARESMYVCMYDVYGVHEESFGGYVRRSFLRRI